MEKIEADVVMVIQADRCGTIIPFWGCDLDITKLHEIAQQECLRLVEEVGGGISSYSINDFRQ